MNFHKELDADAVFVGKVSQLDTLDIFSGSFWISILKPFCAKKTRIYAVWSPITRHGSSRRLESCT